MLQNGQSVLLCGRVGLLKLPNSKQVRQRYTDFVEWFTDTRTLHPSALIYCFALGGSDKSLINNIDGEDECNVLEEGYMRAEQDVTEHPLGMQVNECY